MDTVSLRYFNVYSEDQKADGPYSTAVCNWVDFLKNNKTPFITGDGSQRRDMLHVSDAVSANIFAMEYTGNFKGQFFDVGTGQNISLNELKEIAKIYFPNAKFDYINSRPNEVKNTLANIESLKDIGWYAKIDIQEGVNSCFKLAKEVKNA